MEMAEKTLLEQALWRLELLESQLSARSKDAVEVKTLLKAAVSLSERQAKAKEAADERS